MKYQWLILLLIFTNSVLAQPSKVWVADQGNGTYKNPIIHADYSDPDVIRVGNNYYMTASSFEDIPGLPILQSNDLVNWKIIGHALQKLQPEKHFSKPQHGGGVWAPSIRYRNGEFLIYYPDPDFGIFLVKANDPAGPWSEPLLIEAGKGLIDPCPLWDENGKTYLVHAFAGSRAGIKSIIVVKQMNDAGTKIIGNPVIVYDGHEMDPTIEGPKFYKRNGWYYIFAPAGGVSTGWQLVLRSKNVYGPYERKIVMDQGKTSVNGPHQGAWIQTQTGEDWFIHFQDKESYGRIIHLQPLKWLNDWPVIGLDKNGDGKGEPVTTFKKPTVGKTYAVKSPAESDEFNEFKLGLQWQWMSNPDNYQALLNPSKGVLSLFCKSDDDFKNLWETGIVLQQKFPAESFQATAKIQFFPNKKITGEKAGIVIMGQQYAGLALKSEKEGISLIYIECKDANKEVAEKEIIIRENISSTVYIRVTVSSGAICRFSISEDGINFTRSGESFTAVPGKWKGAKLGIFAMGKSVTNDAGYAEFDWFRVDKD
jgi:beta-xylosidase